MEKSKSLYQAKQDEQSMIIGMSMYQTNIAMKHRKSDIRNPNQDNRHINVPIQYPSIHQKLSMCNQETGTHWLTHQMPHLLHLKFKFDLLWSPVKSPFCGPHISAHAFSTRWQARFLFWKRFYLLENYLESPLLFALFLKGKQNKKENPKCDSLFWKKWSVKKRIGFRSHVTYQKGTVKTVAPL